MTYRLPSSRTTIAALGGIGLAVIAYRLLVPATPAAGKDRLQGRHRVVIVGAGFAGLQAAQVLGQAPDIDLCVIDRQNHHLFQPLLYQVATAALSPDDISTPIRDEVASSGQSHVHMSTVTGIDLAKRSVLCGGSVIPYDTLILATGSEASYFGHEDWQRNAHSLKVLDDAIKLRQQILGMFERAANLPAGNPDRPRMLTFVLIGGGPTGVEMAGSIAELAQDECQRNFGGDPDMRARIILVEAGPALLAEFPPDLSHRATSDLAEMGVEIRTRTSVTAIEDGLVHLGAESVAAETIIWTAGVKATPVAEWLGVKPTHGGRVPVQPDLRVADHPDVYVIGDAAEALNRDGKPLPGLALVAKQQGHYVATAIINRLRGRPPAGAFEYHDFGTLATIGRNKAVAQFGRIHLTGRPAWLLWAGAHIFFLISFRNRVLVSTKWAFSYATHERGGRVIIKGVQ